MTSLPTSPGAGSAIAAAEPGQYQSMAAKQGYGQVSSPVGMSNLDQLRSHIRENFGDVLSPSLETMLFRRGWVNDNIDQFYLHLSQHHTGICSELSRQLSHQDLTAAIEENLLRTLYIGHGQQAVSLVQAFRGFPLEDRFQAMVDPGALTRLISAARSAPSPMHSSSFNSRTSSFTQMPTSPNSNGSVLGGNTSTGQQPYRSSTPPDQRHHSATDSPPTTPPFASRGYGQTTSTSGWKLPGGHASQNLSPYPSQRSQPAPSNNGYGYEDNGYEHSAQAGGAYSSYRSRQAPSAPSPLMTEELEAGMKVSALTPIGTTPPRDGQPRNVNNMNWADATEEDELVSQREALNAARREDELRNFLSRHDSLRLFDVLKKYSLQQLKNMSPKQFDSELKLRICSKAARQTLLDHLHPDGKYPPEPAPAPAPPAPRSSVNAAALATTSASPNSDGIVVPKPASQQVAANKMMPQPRSATRDDATTSALLSTLKVSPDKPKQSPSRYNDPNDRSGGKTSYRDDYEESYSPAKGYRTQPASIPKPARGGRFDEPSTYSSKTSAAPRRYEEEQYDSYGPPRTTRRGEREFTSSRDSSKPGSTKQTPVKGASGRGYGDYEDYEDPRAKASVNTRTPQKLSSVSDSSPGKRIAQSSGSPTGRGPIEVPAPRTRQQGNSPVQEDPVLQLDTHKPVVAILQVAGVRSVNMDDLHTAVARFATIGDELFSGEDGAEFHLTSYKDDLTIQKMLTVRSKGELTKVQITELDIIKKNPPARVHEESPEAPHRSAPRPTRDHSHAQPCRYFFSKEGCQRGEDCKFSHDEAAHGRKGKDRTAPRATAPASRMTKKDSDEAPVTSAPQAERADGASPEVKQATTASAESPVRSPTQARASPIPQPRSVQMRAATPPNDDSTPAAVSAPKEPVQSAPAPEQRAATPPSVTPAQAPSQESQPRASTPPAAAPPASQPSAASPPATSAPETGSE